MLQKYIYIYKKKTNWPQITNRILITEGTRLEKDNPLFNLISMQPKH